MSRSTMLVSAIQKGTVVDHIPPNQSLKIVQFLGLTKTNVQMTLGMHLNSQKLQYKDLIKIQEKHICSEEAQTIAIFAPHATINIIDHYQVCDKFTVSFPDRIHNVFRCSQASCITTKETVSSLFYLKEYTQNVQIICAYCQHMYLPEQLLGC
jgi:aspartate carbamoyltransferase regulatory subunit